MTKFSWTMRDSTGRTQLQLEFTVTGLPANWASADSDSGPYPVTNLESLMLIPESHAVDTKLPCSNGTACSFYVLKYNATPNANASFCFEGSIAGLQNQSIPSYNFLYMNESVHNDNMYTFTRDGALTTDMYGSDKTYYASNSTAPNASGPRYYMVLSEISPPTALLPKPVSGPRMSMKSLFSNNAQVYYKAHSLSTGSGGVTNYRAKQRKT
jgi:hypothetical protein